MNKFLFVGFGLIGRQRLTACLEYGIDHSDLYVYDPNISTADIVSIVSLKQENILRDLSDVLLIGITHAIVAIPHNLAIKHVIKLLDLGIRVLMEKPMGRNRTESEELHAHPNVKNLSVGFNYRFMPGVVQLAESVHNNRLGKISNIKFELGHGGSPNDRKSWKLDPNKAGGGVTLDPGIHLIDLLVFIFGATTKNMLVAGVTSWSGFWETGIEESVNILGYVSEIPLSISLSIVAWRTRFSLEVQGTESYFEVQGRGRTDGPQTVVQGNRWGWLNGSTQKESEIFSMVADKDKSIFAETVDWINNGTAVCSASQAFIGMEIYDLIMKRMNE
jgi:1,5-anhydro-D-fructose reductase (1,5-anhydro-D-mannitol-forming)